MVKDFELLIAKAFVIFFATPLWAVSLAAYLGGNMLGLAIAILFWTVVLYFARGDLK